MQVGLGDGQSSLHPAFLGLGDAEGRLHPAFLTPALQRHNEGIGNVLDCPWQNRTDRSRDTAGTRHAPW